MCTISFRSATGIRDRGERVSRMRKMPEQTVRPTTSFITPAVSPLRAISGDLQCARKSVSRLALVVLVLLSMVLGACKFEDAKYDHPVFLWKVASTGSPGDVWLLGSIHAGNSGMYPLDERLERAYNEADVLGVEADITMTLVQPGIAELMAQQMYTDGTTLEDHVSPELYGKTKRLMESLGTDEVTLDRMKPFTIASQIESAELKAAGYGASYGIDTHFLVKAHEEDKEVVELESVAFQLEMTAGFSEAVQELVLEQAVKGVADSRENLEELFRIWLVGDVASMEKLLNEEPIDEADAEAAREYERIMLDERNISMANKVAGYLQDDRDYLVIVGSAHLVGDGGVVQLLKDMGYEAVQQ